MKTSDAATLVAGKAHWMYGLRLACLWSMAFAAPSALADEAPPVNDDPSAVLAAGDVPIYAEYDKKIAAVQQLGPLTSELFGDQVSLYTGQTEFNQIDIDLPGNDALPVQLRRRWVISSLSDSQYWAPESNPNNSIAGAGNWDVDIPYITGVFDGFKQWDIPTASTRCSSPAFPTSSTDAVRFSTSDIWSGNKIHIPGGGDKSLLRIDRTATPLPPYPTDQQWTTTDLDKIVCIPAAGGLGQGFEVTTTSGITYTFDTLMARDYPAITKPYTDDSGVQRTARSGREKVYLLASQVRDRYGNWVRYQYNGYGQPDKIWSKDGREIDLVYDFIPMPASKIMPLLKSASITLSSPAQTRTWLYTYDISPRDGSRLLSTVVLPDGSGWSYSYTGSTYAVYDTPDTSTNNCIQALPASGTEALSVTMKHPAGAKGTFNFELNGQNRNIDQQHCDTTRNVAVPKKIYTYALTDKKVYSATSSLYDEWAYTYGATGDLSNSVKTIVKQPDGGAVEYVFSSLYDAARLSGVIEGKLLKTNYLTTTGGSIIKTEENTYFTGPDSSSGPFPGQQFPSHYGYGFNSGADDPAAASLRPLKTSTTTQQGVSFVHNNTASKFDAYGRPTETVKSSSLGFTRTETTTYFDKAPVWVLGQVASVQETGGTDQPLIDNTYDLTTAALLSTRKYGRLIRSMTYKPADGTLLTVKDGAGKTTTLGTFKRGIPLSVSYADNTSQSATVDDAGSIRTVTNEKGATTTYDYDPMGRVKKIDYPIDSGVSWNSTFVDYEHDVATTEAGVSLPHWRQTTRTGDARKVVVYDGRWRPTLTSEYDNSTSVRRNVSRTFDYANRETFASYPYDSVGRLTTPSGTSTTYDKLGRVETVNQSTDNGAVLTTSTAYMSGFKRQVTDPRTQVTTTSFQAFDEPSEEAPAKIDLPEGVTVTIQRDRFGNPLTVTRGGTSDGSSLTRSYFYNGYLQLCATKDPESGTTVQTYDAAGNVDWVARGLASSATCYSAVAASDKITFGYDLRNRQTSVQYPAGSNTSNLSQDYYPDGKLKTTTTNGATWSYTYYNRGLLESESLLYGGQSYALDYIYDGNGFLKQLEYPDDTIVDFAPNAIGQPGKAGSYATNVNYFANGAMSGFTYGNGIAHSLSQNVRQLPKQSKDGTIIDRTYMYDEDANVQSITSAVNDGVNLSMTYDGLNRLKTVTAPDLFGATPAKYDYDSLDNLIFSRAGARTCTHAIDSMKNRLESVSGSSSCTGTYLYNARGDVTNRGSDVFAWDMADRLTSATSAGKTENYVYDAHGHRIELARAGSNPSSLYQIYSQAGELLYAYDTAASRATTYVYLNGSLVARNDTVPDNGLPAPSPPTFNPSPSTTGNFTVSWNSVAGATSYVLKETPPGGVEQTVPNVTLQPGPTQSWSTPAPRQNGDYQYRVQACATTCGAFSGTATEQVRTGASGLTVNVNPSKTGLYTLTWTSVPGATRYILKETPAGGIETAVYDSNGTGSLNLTWTTPSAKPDGAFTYVLQACNGSCVSSVPLVETVKTPLPESLRFDHSPVTANTTYSVSWDQVPVATTYRIDEKSSSASTWTPLTTSSSTSRSITGGHPLGTWSYRVRACRSTTDLAYCGDYATANQTVVAAPVSVPDIPTGLNSYPNSSTDGNYTVSWFATGATSYDLQEQYRYGDSYQYGDSTFHPVVPAPTGKSWSPSPAKTGYGKYIYKVRACNSSGCSDYSAIREEYVEILSALPGRPTMQPVVPNPSTTGSYTVSWTASTSASATRYELEELTGSVLPWVPQTTTLTGTSWTPPTPRPNGHYDYRVRGCNVYGCGSYNLATVPGSVDVQIPTGSPMTVPANFAAIPTDVVAGNNAKFYWDPVTGADAYHLRQEDLFCGTNQIPLINVPANTAMPYKRPLTTPACNGQARSSATYDFAIQACAGSVCSEWSPTIRVTVTSGANPNSTASTVTTTTYIHTDALRSASVETNALGAVLSRTNYEPYGKVLGTASQGPGYAGHVTDATTGLSYMQQRYYDPIGGRFLSIDPVAADPNSGANFNRYWYANNNPYRNIDPDGRNPVLAALVISVGIDWLLRPEIANAPAPGEATFSNVMSGVEVAQEVARVVPAGKLGSMIKVGAKAIGKLSQNAAAREAKRQAGIPTSQQPSSQTNGRAPDGTPVGRQQSYEVPTPGGGTDNKSVQVSRDMRGDHAGMSQIEAGTVKPGGQTDPAGRPRLQNEDKVRVDFEPKR